MKHVTYADKSLLVGDEEADAIMEYARVLADNGRADTVSLRSISADGNTVDAMFLLSANTTVMVESTNSEVTPPDNTGAVADIRSRIAAVTRPAQAQPGDPWTGARSDIDELY